MSFPSPKEFYDQFKADSEAAKRKAFQLGVEMGQELKRRYSIHGQDLEAVAAILNAAMRAVKGGLSIRVSVEDQRVILQNAGFCAVMRAALTLKIPWEWLDENFAWPWLEGIASVVMPRVKLSVQSARCRGDTACVHMFEIE